MTAVAQLVTFLVAMGTLAVAYNQYRVSRDALRLSLFEKRLGIYEQATELLAAVSWDDLDPGRQASFQRAIQEARFLFGAEVPERLMSLFWLTDQYLRARSDTAQQAGDVADTATLTAIRAAIAREEARLTEIFMPYLSFKLRG